MKKILSLILMLGLLSSCQSVDSISLDDLIHLQPAGVDGQGTVMVSIDTSLMDVLYEETDLSVYQIDNLFNSIEVDFNIEPYLVKNGDHVVGTLNYNKSYGVNFEWTDNSIEVTDLPDSVIVSEDVLLEHMDFNFSSYSGDGSLVYSNQHDDPYINSLTIFNQNEFRNGEYRNGDRLVFSVSADEAFEKAGYELEVNEFTIVVENLPELLTSLELVDEDVIEKLETIGLEAIEQYLDEQDEAIVFHDYEVERQGLKVYEVVGVLPSQLRDIDLELSRISVIYYKGQRAWDGSPVEDSSLMLMYEAQLEIDGYVYEQFQIAVSNYRSTSTQSELDDTVFDVNYYGGVQFVNRRGFLDNIYMEELTKYDSVYYEILTMDTINLTDSNE